jgi:hypothetical protein
MLFVVQSINLRRSYPTIESLIHVLVWCRRQRSSHSEIALYFFANNFFSLENLTLHSRSDRSNTKEGTYDAKNLNRLPYLIPKSRHSEQLLPTQTFACSRKAGNTTPFPDCELMVSLWLVGAGRLCIADTPVTAEAIRIQVCGPPVC